MFKYRHRRSSPEVLIVEGSVSLGSALVPWKWGGSWGWPRTHRMRSCRKATPKATAPGN